jgi:hypothetical protein
MIKFFKNEDLIFTKYSISTEKISNNIVPTSLVAGTSGTFRFPIKLNVRECNNNKSGSCDESLVDNAYFLQVNNNLNDSLNFQIGKKSDPSVVFYESSSIYYDPSENPINRDGTYKRQVYNTTKNMYYNDYNNSYNQFGFDGLDTSNAQLTLSDEFSSLKLNIKSTGNRILQNSIKINNQSGDIIAYIIDDGNNNLILSGSYFIDKCELTSSSTDLIRDLVVGSGSI